MDRIAVRDLLAAFVRGDDRSIAFAGRLEVALDDVLPDDEEAQDIVLALASYAPGGGPYLHDEQAMVHRCERLLRRLSLP